MTIHITQSDKILSIISSGLSILTVCITQLFKPEMMDKAIIFAVVLIAVTIIGLTIKTAIQSRRIKEQEIKIQSLEESQNQIRRDLAEKEKRIELLEKLMNVPFFKKWNLLYTYMWRSSIPLLNNPVSLFEIHVTRKLLGSGRLKDNCVTYKFSGECVEKIETFRFCLAGAGTVPLEKLNFGIKDLALNRELEHSVLKDSKDADIKYIEVHFVNPKYPGDILQIEFAWQWPKTAFVKTDYFSIPNIYSSDTKQMILDFIPTQDMKLSAVETYKFGLNDKAPVKIGHHYIDAKGCYRSTIDHPEKDADYITYYE